MTDISAYWRPDLSIDQTLAPAWKATSATAYS